MTQNLRVTKDQEGNSVKYYLPNEDSINASIFGHLYDYEVACKVCPEGWRLPTNDDWEELQATVGPLTTFYKEPGFWKNELITNPSAFAARPGGYGNTEHNNRFRQNTLFWSKTKEDEHFAWTFIVESDKDSVRMASQHPEYAFSVRCVK